jgi:hypothetical protein
VRTCSRENPREALGTVAVNLTVGPSAWCRVVQGDSRFST